MTNYGSNCSRLTELLPCPFCGGEAEVHPSSDWNTRFSGKTFFVWCDKCETRGDYYNTEAEAVAAWNARAERTCEDANTRFNAWTCSECKCTLLLMFDDFGEPTLNVDGIASVPSYCPNCGARVIA